MWWSTTSRCSGFDERRKEMLGIKEIQEIIPHRHPFLLIDCIEELEPGVRAVGYKCVTFDEPQFRGHFPQESESGAGNPVWECDGGNYRSI